MFQIKNITAVFFDMDGTLVDSEPYTALSVYELCRETGYPDVDINCSKFDGLSWTNIALNMIEQAPGLSKIQNIPGRLHEIFHDLLKNNPLPLIKQARETVIAAHAVMPTAIISSRVSVLIKDTLAFVNPSKKRSKE